MNVLDKIMKPKSIAVVGASTKPKTIGSGNYAKIKRITNLTAKFIRLTLKAEKSKASKLTLLSLKFRVKLIWLL